MLSEQVMVRVTEEEKRQIEAAAALEKRSMGQLLRILAMPRVITLLRSYGVNPDTVDPEDLPDIVPMSDVGK